MEVHSLRYERWDLTASFIYLILAQRLQLYDQETIVKKISISAEGILKNNKFS